MIQGLVEKFTKLTVSIGADPRDSDEVHLQKILLVAAVLLIIPLTAFWIAIYWAFDEPVAAAIPLTYSLVSIVSIIIFARTKSYPFFRFTQLAMMLLLPFLLQLDLGGFINSSVVIMWALLVPIVALALSGIRSAVALLVSYLALVVLSALAQPFVRPHNSLPFALILTFFVMNISGVSLVTFAVLAYTLRLLQLEQQKSENLLLNILPKEIAPILKKNPGTIAEAFDCASILFADIVNFTPWSVELPPKEMVEMLNEIFSYFDALVERYAVEKIRTIGDNYMVASGVPTPRPDHAQALTRTALEMSAYITSRPPRNGKHLDFRIGINSGAVVAGVIGMKKFVYDLWGDPVNTASRMESTGAPGKIQITRATYDLIKDEFLCEPRGVVSVKGKGEMETWFLVGERARADASRIALETQTAEA